MISKRGWTTILLSATLLFIVADDALAARRFFRRGRNLSAVSPKPTIAAVKQPLVEKPALAAPPSIRIDPAQAMADILALRAAQTGAAVTDDGEFTSALQRLIAEKHGETVAPLEQPPVATGAVDTDALAALRNSLLHFEQRAAELEAAKAYAEADAARATAAGLRQEIRRLDP